jgi:hypothetical protein
MHKLVLSKVKHGFAHIFTTWKTIHTFLLTYLKKTKLENEPSAKTFSKSDLGAYLHFDGRLSICSFLIQLKKSQGPFFSWWQAGDFILIHLITHTLNSFEEKDPACLLVPNPSPTEIRCWARKGRRQKKSTNFRLFSSV